MTNTGSVQTFDATIPLKRTPRAHPKIGIDSPESFRRDRSHLDLIRAAMCDGNMSGENQSAVTELKAMRERVRAIRADFCEPKSNANPRYLTLSNVVSNLTKAIEDLEAEAR